MTTPTAHRSICIVFSRVVLGLAGWGVITAEAVMLFSSSLRCGASGALRLPCPDGHKEALAILLMTSYCSNVRT
ncbi:hypothetical protein S576_23490 [Salmonella enterica subsp. enterica serovar Give]|nr:hypothetical protein [Salmonella enterica subsp. enterica serovar Give]EED4548117.1 hypothetical protein [Salmonella enterica subsp. enterica serovar Give]